MAIASIKALNTIIQSPNEADHGARKSLPYLQTAWGHLGKNWFGMITMSGGTHHPDGAEIDNEASSRT